MTQSIPEKYNSTTNQEAEHQRLMELVEAEDAVSGEFGCGRMTDMPVSVYLEKCSINIDDENFRNLLRSHLGYLLTERDFDSITSQVSHYIESLLIGTNSSLKNQVQSSTELVEHIPTAELQELLQVELGEFLAIGDITQIIQYTHQVVHKAVLRPRHTWPDPIWVLTSGVKLYIAQAASLSDAITRVHTQYPQETGVLEVVKVGGVLTPNPVVAIDLGATKL